MEGSQWTAEPWAPGEASSVVALPPIGVENHCNYARDYTVRRPSASRCRPNLAFAVTAVFTSVLTLIFAISLCFHPVVRATQPRTALRRLSAGVETPETPTSDGSPEYLCEVALSVGRSPSEMPESPELPVETTEPKEEATQMHDTEYNEKTPSTDASEGWNERGNNMPLEGENPMFTNPVTKTINESFPASPVEEEDESEVPSSSVEVIEISDSPEEERYPEVVIILDEDSVDCTKEIEMSPKVRTPTGPPVSPPSVKLSPLFYDKVVGKRERQTRLFDGFDEPPAKRLAAGEGEPDLAVEISRLDSLLDDPPRTAVDLVRTRLLHWPQPQPPYFPARVKLGDGVEYPLGHVGANALTLGRSKHGNYLTAGGFGDSIPNDIYLALFGIPDIDKSAGPRFEVPEAGESADQDQGPVVISSDSDDGASAGTYSPSESKTLP
ncbi:hypothetical protein, conserved [Eimeria tenella]|uniref:Transmembrane protein n=1 Tax=Eimeria tenella TaxID=5802 RepID=U6KWN2_EIMTE|nr:hypothetical protein, conserved [Eimeria tenella]CDJ41338.1 hypothetical protein, conserved [Eimeria tenella]|eukprot:XP_013232088.1 hypothetical protein, conserved [Eimeria tenella]